MHRSISLRLGLAATALALWTGVHATAFGQESPSVETRDAGDLGTILTDASGMTLYTYAPDTAGMSTCYDKCATAWPPATVNADPVAPEGLAGTLGVTQRTDGGEQLTYNGMPLYYYADDKDSKDTYGQGIGGVWFVVNPS
jgi:predicted lipoprotein with Yx(FWY)xxD motif